MPKVRMNFAPWQARFSADPSRYKAVIGGVGSGKSVGVSEDLIDAVTDWPRSQSLFILGTYKQAKEGATKTLQDRVELHFGKEGVGWSRNKTDLSITILRGPAKGHRVVLWSAESYESLKSAEYDFIWADEVQTWEHPKEAIAFLFTRQRNSPQAVRAYSQLDEYGDPIPDTCALAPRMWITANPPWTTSHYLYERFVEKRDPNDPFSFYHVKTSDNTLLPRRAEYIAGLKRELPPDIFKIEVLGEWGDIGVGRVYTSFAHDRMTSPDSRLPSLRRNPDGSLWKDASGRHRVALDPLRPLVWNQDFGVMPRASTIGQVHVLPAHIAGYQSTLCYWLDAIEIPGGSTDVMIDEFVRRYPPMIIDNRGVQHRRRVYVYGDPAGSGRTGVRAEESDWAYMQQDVRLKPYDIRFIYKGAAPPIVDRVNATNAKLCNALGEIGMLFDPGDGDEHPAAAPALTDFQKTMWKKGTRQLDHGTPSKGLFRTHCSDTIGYFVDYEWPIVIPARGRVVGHGVTRR